MNEVNDLLKRLGELEDAPLIWVNKKVYDMAEEIERLNKENKELDKACARKSRYIDKKDLEIGRLNNIINNLEEYSETEIKYWEKEYKFSDHYDKANILGYITALKNILNKMKELKGVDKNCK